MRTISPLSGGSIFHWQVTMSGRHLIQCVALIATISLLVLAGGAVAEAQELDPVFADLQERTFRFFWDTANPQNGLIPDRYPTNAASSIASL